jgi:hypothetical protein
LPSFVNHAEVVKKVVVRSPIHEHTPDDQTVLRCHEDVTVRVVLDAPTEVQRVHFVDSLPRVPIQRLPYRECISSCTGQSCNSCKVVAYSWPDKKDRLRIHVITTT